MPWPIILAAEFTLLISATLLARWYRNHAVVVAIVSLLAAALAMPFLLAHNMYLRGVASLAAVFVVLMTSQAARIPATWGAGMRAWHAFAVGDVLRARRTQPQFDLSLALHLAVYGAAVATVVVALLNLPRPALSLPALLLGAVFGYCASEVMFGLARFVHRLAGWDTPRLQNTPAASRSVAEFWGERWNSLMTGWLAEVAYKPLARRKHPAMGVVAAFALSALIHAVLFAAPFGFRAAGMVAAFFLVQAVFIFIERAMKIRRWPEWLARMWTVGMLLISSPLFTYPILRGAGMR